MNLGRQKFAGASAALALGVTLVGGMPATAGDGEVIRAGSCARSTDWSVKAKPENGRIQVDGEIDSSRNRQAWRWRIVHNNSLSARGERVTRRPSGSFTVQVVVVNLRGTDDISFRARNPRTGEVCRGSVRF